uniref:ascorbate ferrireductase (transmembrane) n=1 Tax=Cyprinodon variegatus TaxID=28743 RepID=A0A3Q2E6Y8_CYPVA
MIHKETESDAWFYTLIRAVSAGLAHLISGVFPAFIAFLSRPGTSDFILFFFNPAILLFSPHASLIKRFPHKTKGRVHWILQGLCASCAVLGLVAISYNKYLNGKAHFSSWHGLLGLITVCVVCVQSLAAVPLIYHSLAKGWSLAKLKRYHAASGLVTFLLGSTSLLLGLCSSWFTASVGGYAWYLVALCPTLSAVIIMNQVSSAYIAKKRLQS